MYQRRPVHSIQGLVRFWLQLSQRPGVWDFLCVYMVVNVEWYPIIQSSEMFQQRLSQFMSLWPGLRCIPGIWLALTALSLCLFFLWLMAEKFKIFEFSEMFGWHLLGSRLRAWTKSRLLQCCINVHVSVQSGQSMDNKKKRKSVHPIPTGIAISNIVPNHV